MPGQFQSFSCRVLSGSIKVFPPFDELLLSLHTFMRIFEFPHFRLTSSSQFFYDDILHFQSIFVRVLDGCLVTCFVQGRSVFYAFSDVVDNDTAFPSFPVCKFCEYLDTTGIAVPRGGGWVVFFSPLFCPLPSLAIPVMTCWKLRPQIFSCMPVVIDC